MSAAIPPARRRSCPRCGRSRAGSASPTTCACSRPGRRCRRSAGLAGLSGAADLLLRFSPVPVLGVTGSAGKTTTARLAEAMLRASGSRGAELERRSRPTTPSRPPTCSSACSQARPPAWCVAELTSNHLAVCSASPQIACITNVWPDHVDQHGSLAAYLAAKRAHRRVPDGRRLDGRERRRPGRRELAAASPRPHPAGCTLRGPAGRPGRGRRVRAPARAARRARRTTSGPAAALPPAPGPRDRSARRRQRAARGCLAGCDRPRARRLAGPGAAARAPRSSSAAPRSSATRSPRRPPRRPPAWRCTRPARSS